MVHALSRSSSQRKQVCESDPRHGYRVPIIGTPGVRRYLIFPGMGTGAVTCRQLQRLRKRQAHDVALRDWRATLRRGRFGLALFAGALV